MSHDLVDGPVMLAGFARALSAAGLAVGPDRTVTFFRAARVLGAGERAAVYWAGRATLTASGEEIACYDSVFDAWFSDRPPPVTGRPRIRPAPLSTLLPSTQDLAGGADAADDEPPLRARAALAEVLRDRDLAKLTLAERAELHRMLTLLRPGLPVRRSPRRRPDRHGAVDRRRTVRAMLAGGGEPGLLRRRRPKVRPRRIVLLIDISGSMSAYADSLVRFAHVLVRHRPGAVEVFTIGTRLSRITRPLAIADPDAALAAAAAAIPDHAGGTRLGEVLRAFNDRWGRRGTARGAVVVVFSDGWERGSADLLAEQVQHLSRLSRQLVWVNPHKGHSGYSPVQTGIVAVLPHLDHFLAGHSLATLEQLLEVIRNA